MYMYIYVYICRCVYIDIYIRYLLNPRCHAPALTLTLSSIRVRDSHGLALQRDGFGSLSRNPKARTLETSDLSRSDEVRTIPNTSADVDAAFDKRAELGRSGALAGRPRLSLTKFWSPNIRNQCSLSF